MTAERCGIAVPMLQLMVADGRVDGAMADRMDGRSLPTAAAFRNEVMLLHPSTERAPAQKAGSAVQRCWSQRRHANQPSTTTPTRTQKATIPQKAQGRSA